MADYKYSHLEKSISNPRDISKLSKREAKVQLDCKKRISNFSLSKLGKKLVWLHIKNTSAT